MPVAGSAVLWVRAAEPRGGAAAAAVGAGRGDSGWGYRPGRCDDECHRAWRKGDQNSPGL